MSTLQDNWHSLFDRQELLTQELISAIQAERDALLADDVDRLRNSTLTKDKAARKLALIRDEANQLKLQSIRELKLSPKSEILDILKTFEKTVSRSLQQKRLNLRTLMQTATRQNAFNNDCLNVYLDHINSVRSILSLVYDRNTTYDTQGITSRDDKRSLINRSI